MRRVLPACLVFAIAALSIVAADGEEVPLYTNADLEGVESVEPSVDVADDPAGWAIVNDFIDREHARIEADRQHDLERRRVEIEAEQPVGYGAPYYGWGSYGFYGDDGYYGHHDGGDGHGANRRSCPRPSGDRRAPGPRAHPRATVIGGPIVPIHAR